MKACAQRWSRSRATPRRPAAGSPAWRPGLTTSRARTTALVWLHDNCPGLHPIRRDGATSMTSSCPPAEPAGASSAPERLLTKSAAHDLPKGAGLC